MKVIDFTRGFKSTKADSMSMSAFKFTTVNLITRKATMLKKSVWNVIIDPKAIETLCISLIYIIFFELKKKSPEHDICAYNRKIFFH